MGIGIDSLATTTADVAAFTIKASDRLRNLVEEIERPIMYPVLVRPISLSFVRRSP
jgi:hypothetical protein